MEKYKCAHVILKLSPQYFGKGQKVIFQLYSTLISTKQLFSHHFWKAAGKPRQGPVYDKRNKCRLAYWQLIREEEKREKIDIHK